MPLHGAPRIGERGFAVAVAGEPGALQAGQLAGGIGDDAKKRGPGLARAAIIGTVIACGMKAQRRPVKAGGDAASAQIGFGECARHGARERMQFRGGGPVIVRRHGWPALAGDADKLGLAQKMQGFFKGIAERFKAFVEADEIEQIAMLAGRGVCIMCS